MAELADALDSGSSEHYAHEGSSPFSCTYGSEVSGPFYLQIITFVNSLLNLVLSPCKLRRSTLIIIPSCSL